ncbi:MAG: multidrug efflux SMR transporter [Alphaproteobacteria bacterium]|nr:multidrug efflux SMR transporter [Alphaproteobacteria bacterium]
MAWLYLLIAAVFEVGWPVGLKMAEISPVKFVWIVFAVVAMTLSGLFLYMAQKTIPIGTAYAVWTGIGASCTFAVGILFFHNAVSFIRCLGIVFIVFGVACLKYGH